MNTPGAAAQASARGGRPDSVPGGTWAQAQQPGAGGQPEEGTDSGIANEEKGGGRLRDHRQLRRRPI